ncbi:MAG: hypothetical protein K2O00_09455 [Muribaculaceae bacterium]|nr:hypothetical protein [Muribaculaceae bacterium]
MKKILLSFILLFSMAAAALAIPRGVYVDNRGNAKYLVDNSGTEIYTLDRNGNVLVTRMVVREEYDYNSGSTKVTLRTAGMNVETVIYYREENGNVLLDDGLRVLHRE